MYIRIPSRDPLVNYFDVKGSEPHFFIQKTKRYALGILKTFSATMSGACAGSLINRFFLDDSQKIYNYYSDLLAIPVCIICFFPFIYLCGLGTFYLVQKNFGEEPFGSIASIICNSVTFSSSTFLFLIDNNIVGSVLVTIGSVLGCGLGIRRLPRINLETKEMKKEAFINYFKTLLEKHIETLSSKEEKNTFRACLANS